MKQLNSKSSLGLLKFLIGKWHTEGEIRAGLSTPILKIKGTDTYEWALDGNFILHRVDVMIGNEKTEAIEMIGEYDVTNKVYQMRSFDNQGNFETMQANINEHNVLYIMGNNMRATLYVNNNGSCMTAHWEKSADGLTWQPWMDLTLTK